MPSEVVEKAVLDILAESARITRAVLKFTIRHVLNVLHYVKAFLQAKYAVRVEKRRAMSDGLKALNRKSQRAAMLAGGFLLLIVGGYGYVVSYSATHGEDPLLFPLRTITRTTLNPSEKPINTRTAAYIVPADQPRLINMPSINAEAFIQKVDVDSGRKMAVPTNVHLAGWYVGAKRPGENGLAVIDGHVSGRYSSGVFQKLQQLQRGSKFSVEFGDGASKTFVVTKVQLVSLNDATRVLFWRDPTIDAQLNLITCGGDFDTTARLYNKRVIVTSALIQS
jgi:LPXTG-site transpeptidase (sortase) family protein